MKTIYIPKGGMCAICCHCFDDCSGLSFQEMKALETEGDIITVLCSVFVRKTKAKQ